MDRLVRLDQPESGTIEGMVPPLQYMFFTF